MYRSIILPEAREDIREVAKWYNKQQNGLGKIFTAEVREKVQYIRQNPLASNVRYEGVRTAVLQQFPFMGHFAVDEIDQIVIISAVLHTSRNPQTWSSR